MDVPGCKLSFRIVRLSPHRLAQINQRLLRIAAPIEGCAEAEIVAMRLHIIAPGERQGQPEAIGIAHEPQITSQIFGAGNVRINLMRASLLVNEHQQRRCEVAAVIEQVTAEHSVTCDGVLALAREIDNLKRQSQGSNRPFACCDEDESRSLASLGEWNGLQQPGAFETGL